MRAKPDLIVDVGSMSAASQSAIGLEFTSPAGRTG
jgi:hypothetical protein